MSTPARLPYYAPFDWPRMLRFLHARSLAGVELVRDDAYYRTVQIGSHTGWIGVHDAPGEMALVVDSAPSLAPVLPALLECLRDFFDLRARPDHISAHFAGDRVLASAVSLRPGLRVPGAFDGFELAARAILGQQITVRAATTIAGWFAAELGEPFVTPHAGLTHLSPTVERVAATSTDTIGSLGIIRTRARSLIAVAKEMHDGRLRLEPCPDPETVIDELVELPGIGAWTAHYIAMRALRWANAFPRGDIALRNALGGVSAARADQLSEPWRPWRSYATIHLWCDAGERASGAGFA